MNPICRIGDAHSDGGVVSTGSPTVRANNIPVARIGDQAPCPQRNHGVPTIVTGSATVRVNNIPVARIGSSLSCGAVMVQGSPTVRVGT